jgi:hypothetical protein
MFEEKKRQTWTYIWGGIALVVIGGIVVIQLVRVNPPKAEVNSTAPVAPLWTSGAIVTGSATVAAKDILTFPVNLNKRSDLKGTFTTGEAAKRIGNLMIKAADLEKWKAGEQVPSVFSTGPVPRSTVSRSVEAGNYLLIFDNRSNDQEMNLSDVDFSVD